MSPEALGVVTWVGTILSAIGAIIAIQQAILARTYKDQIQVDIRKLNVLRSAERLRKAQESIRKLPSDQSRVQRGHKTEALIEKIRECFDEVLGILPVDGDDVDIRSAVDEAQTALTSYEDGLNQQKLNASMTSAVRAPLQNAVSLANDRVLKIEGKA